MGNPALRMISLLSMLLAFPGDAVALLSRNKHVPIHAACDAKPNRSVRTFLRTLSAPHHGSTALESVLMSSAKVATLCAGETWGCEGLRILERRFDLDIRNKHDSDEDEDEETDAPYANCEDEEPRDMHLDELPTLNASLPVWSEYWDLNRPLLLEKKTKFIESSIRQDEELLQMKQLPPSMQALGVTELRPAYIIMYRPICLWSISDASLRKAKLQPRCQALHELRQLERAAHLHRNLTRSGRKTLVVDYAKLLWNPERTRERLLEFLPCAVDLDMDHLPVLGKEVFRKNKFKVELGVKSFGERLDPLKSAGYQIGDPSKHLRGQCLDHGVVEGFKYSALRTMLNNLKLHERQRWRDAMNYLEPRSD
mmetsp:Transcript_45034/g.97812  ORF Transcript_45034/g.97812 Transcript_45034/m.97812 type:complete len:368 (+) Transcript_45034:52-1155(+)|eukprot:CAMPEP_0170600018 /NCGR_PEP_ID=MMETSP0224-20130122/17112_1 /TAXON_ID=285029 /ORGANISM="Togula jolla, Strain CCCM 725" /LENGTH=367 /DNA_ID=CAMNT_0010924719 /DNA_START=47 /DNA_END=1150 /DNA_ORIENTATION=+